MSSNGALANIGLSVRRLINWAYRFLVLFLFGLDKMADAASAPSAPLLEKKADEGSGETNSDEGISSEHSSSASDNHPEKSAAATAVVLSEEEIEAAKKKATTIKDVANGFFKKCQYDKAISFYSQAIDAFPSPASPEDNKALASFYSNRSFAYLRNDCPAAALKDAEQCIETDAKFIKGYYRRASANMLLLKFEDALKDFRMVTMTRKKDADAKQKFQLCQREVQKMRFLRAIGSKDGTGAGSGDSASQAKVEDYEQFDVDSIVVQSDYKGPRLEGEITVEFVDKLVEHLKEQKKLSKRYLWRIMKNVFKQFKAMKSLVDIDVSDQHEITVCGDTHGQFYDLCHILEMNGKPCKERPYLFNGDFVDRGSFSVEVIVTLFAYKMLYPDYFHLTRGNHETKNMNELYGFHGEVTQKYDTQTYEFFTEIFNWLPLSYCLNSSTGRKVVVMHGGLFQQDNVTLDDIRNTSRNHQPPESGIMTDILWADPCTLSGRQPSKRGTSIQFGPDVTAKFCQQNGVEYIVRSHEVKDEGYEKAHDGKCYTIFSAPNYCDQMGNEGAYIHIRGPDLEPRFTKFKCVPHPKVAPMAFSNPLLRLAGLM